MIATCMAWLNDVKAGGGTAFIHPGRVSIQGVKSLWGDRFGFFRDWAPGTLTGGA